MKIALIRYKFTPFGGAERYMSRLIRGLRSAGHEIHVFAAEWDTDAQTEFPVHRVPVTKLTGWLKALTFSLNCRRLIRQEKMDVIFSLERTLLQDIYRAGDGCHRIWLIRKNLGKGILHKAWTWLNPFQLAYIWLERRMFTNPALKAIIANSRRGKEEIIDLYGVDPARIHVVYNGIDPVIPDPELKVKQRQALGDEFSLGNELRILYVGSGFKRKGVATAIRALADLHVPFRFFIVGKGRPAGFQRLAKRLGIKDSIIFTGPRRDVELFYQGCDLFVFPTLYDPFSNATLEALAHGLPVITSQFNGVAELIQQDDNGFVVDNPLDHVSLATHLNSLTDPLLRLRIGLRAAETAADYTMERNVRETLGVLQSIGALTPGSPAANHNNHPTHTST